MSPAQAQLLQSQASPGHTALGSSRQPRADRCCCLQGPSDRPGWASLPGDLRRRFLLSARPVVLCCPDVGGHAEGQAAWEWLEASCTCRYHWPSCSKSAQNTEHSSLYCLRLKMPNGAAGCCCWPHTALALRITRPSCQVNACLECRPCITRT